ncbi:siderophore-interacting protein [Aeromicrobium marinum]|uniref:siderophore-interacting protein n=1 Tax=Aeromicrobium marinum TaxID=219314 RepID=UPI00068166C4|nr:siderophore-interacting protein [Aeromicrobium marinum]
MKIHTATVVGRRRLSAHLVTVTLGDLEGYPTTGVPDEYVRVMIAPEGEPLVLPQISETWEVTQPEGTTPPVARVYTISDHRLVDGRVQVDLDVALHDRGAGSDWARTCEPGEQVGLVEPHGLYAAAADVGWQLLVADVTGLPALARILRGLRPGQRVRAVVVLTDEDDRIALPSAADVEVRWVVVERETDIAGALEEAVTGTDLPGPDTPGGRYVWLAGEARASRAVRRHLRRTLGWPQSDFYTCGYWQVDAETWNARYEEVASEVIARAEQVRAEVGDDEGSYLDALDEIYESAGL